VEITGLSQATTPRTLGSLSPEGAPLQLPLQSFDGLENLLLSSQPPPSLHSVFENLVVRTAETFARSL